MKQILKFSIGIIILSFYIGCKKEATLPNLTYTPLSNITDSTAVSGGLIIDDGGASITARGVCWDTIINPLVSKNKTIDGKGIGTFVSSAFGLKANTTYFLRAYASNSVGTAYSANAKFITTSELPIISTSSISVIASNFAYCGGIITSQGANGVISKGVCWSTSETPTISDSKTINGKSEGDFKSTLTNLKPNTKYFVRAYATNSTGTKYGNQQEFTTGSTVSDYDGNIYNTVLIGTQIWMVENLRTSHYNNGDAIATTTLPLTSADITPKYQWVYNNDLTNLPTYGRLYTYHTVIDSRGICPIGWRLPKYSDFVKLVQYLDLDGSQSTAGGFMKEEGTKHWLSPNKGASNSSGFTALPGGYRDISGIFKEMGKYAGFWMASDNTSTLGYDFNLRYMSTFLSNGGEEKSVGISVRCLKD